MPLRLRTSLAVIACAYFGAWFAHYAGTALLGNAKLPFSAVMVAILVGMVIGNLWPRFASDSATLKFCRVTVLRVGIVLLGLRLSLTAAIGLGLQALPVVLICITAALLLVTVASRAAAISPQLAALIAVGTSICGVTAIVATVMGAALIYQDQYSAVGSLEAATVTKLVRNLMMAAVIPLIAFLYQDRARPEGNTSADCRPSVAPGFVLGFIALCALRSVGDFGDLAFGLIGRDKWSSIIGGAQTLSELCLTVAMVAVGLQTRIAAFTRIGLKPLLLAMLTAAVVGGVSLLSIRFLFGTA